MSLAVKILIFVGYLFFVVLYTAASLVAAQQLLKGLRSRSAAGLVFRGLAPLDVVGYIFLFGTLGILAFFFDAAVIGLMLATTLLGYLITVISWALLGPFERPVGSDMTWSNASLMVRRGYQRAQNIIGAVMLFVLLVALGYVFFTRDVPSTQATQDILKVLTFWLSAIFVVSQLPARLATLSSRNLDEPVRDRLLAAQTGTLFTWAILVSLALWSFEVGPSAGLGAASVDAGLAVKVAVIVAAIFVLTSVLPYLIGSIRAKQWRQYLREKRRRLFQQLEDALRSPSQAVRESRLQDVEGRLDSDREALLSDPLIALADRWDSGLMDHGALAETGPLVYDAYQDVGEADPRVEQLHVLKRLQSELETLDQELKAGTVSDEAMNAYAENYALAQKNLGEEIEVAKVRRSWLLASSVFVMSGIAGTIQSKVGERIWEMVGTSG